MMQQQPRVGFIGFGEAAFHIAAGLKGAGLQQILAFDKAQDDTQSALVRRRAQEAGVEMQQTLSSLVRSVDIVFSTVSANVVVALAKESAFVLRPGQIYADLNAAGPQAKISAAALISPTGALFVDGAVMGTVPGLGHKVPTLVSGVGAKALVLALQPFGMNLQYMAGEAGRASGSKMMRSIFMKGFVALLLETVVAGRKYNIEDDLLLSIAETLTAGPFLETVNGLICRGVIHAERRAHEMQEVIATLEDLAVDSTMSQATRRKLELCAQINFKEHFHGVPPKDFHEIFNLLETHSPGTTG